MKIVMTLSILLWIFCLISAVVSVFIVTSDDLTISVMVGIIFNTINLIILTIFNILAFKELRNKK